MSFTGLRVHVEGGRRLMSGARQMAVEVWEPEVSGGAHGRGAEQHDVMESMYDRSHDIRSWDLVLCVCVCACACVRMCVCVCAGRRGDQLGWAR